jgi:hypothetical protein
MAKTGQRKCLCCQIFFDVDPRIGKRQRYCSKPDCRSASKAASRAAWLAKPQNQDYFRDPVHVSRVQAWRAEHPGYSRGKRRGAPALQDLMVAQVNDFIEESSNRGETPGASKSAALQDLLNAPTPVLAGLIAHVFGAALQDEFEATTRRLVQMGHDLIKGRCHEQAETSAAS